MTQRIEIPFPIAPLTFNERYRFGDYRDAKKAQKTQAPTADILLGSFL